MGDDRNTIVEWADRIDTGTLIRLAQAHERVSVCGAGAWDGIDLNDLLHDLLMARTQREKYWLGMHPDRPAAKAAILRSLGLHPGLAKDDAVAQAGQP